MSSLRRFFSSFLFASLTLSSTLAAAPSMESLSVIAVTDMTEIGRTYPEASPDSPVYYQAVTTGYQDFGRGMAGEKEPENDAFLQTVLRTLKREGYVPATDAHPPTIVLGFSWGSLRSQPGAALKVLGGDKLDLMWEVETTTGLDVRQWLRGMRAEKAQRVLELSKEDLFVMNVAAYDRSALVKGELVPLWQTRIACPTRGVWAADALPQIVQVAGPVIGRETKTPELSTVGRAFGKAGSVEIGDLTVVDEDFDLATMPVLDLTKETEPE